MDAAKLAKEAKDGSRLRDLLDNRKENHITLTVYDPSIKKVMQLLVKECGDHKYSINGTVGNENWSIRSSYQLVEQRFIATVRISKKYEKVATWITLKYS